MIAVLRLDRALLERHLEAIIAVAQDVPGEYWSAKHFRAGRPSKFSLSRLGLAGGAVVGYAIVSARSADTCHLHHLMVRTQDRGSGVGRVLLEDAMAAAVRAGHGRMTLKVAPGNNAARRLYARLGFAPAGEENGLAILSRELP